MSNDPYSISFNSRWVTAFVELNKVFTETLSQKNSLTVTQYRILLELHSSNGVLSGTDFSERLVLTSATISNALNGLEDRELILRKENEFDRRIVSASITKKGVALLEEASENLFQELAFIWRNLTEEDIATIIESTKCVVNGMRSFTYVNAKEKIKPFYMTTIVVMCQVWSANVKKKHALSFSEARVLLFLHETQLEINNVKLSYMLIIGPSMISKTITQLVDKGLVQRMRQSRNRRDWIVQLTETGTTVSEELMTELSETNHMFYQDVPPEMHDDLNRINDVIYEDFRLHRGTFKDLA